MRRPEDRVRPVDGRQVQRVFVLGPRGRSDRHQPAGRPVVLHHRRRQVAPAEARAQQRLLRVQVGHPPGPRRQHRLIGHARRPALRQHHLHVLAEAAAVDLPLDLRQRVIGRHHRDHADRRQRPALEPRRHGDRRRHSERRRPGQHARGHGGHRLGVDAQRHRRERRREFAAQRHQHRQREQRVDAQRHRRLEPAGDPRRQPAQRVDLAGHPARRGQDRLARLGQRRHPRRAVEHRHVELALEVGDRLADRRLDPAQPFGRRREAPGLRDRRQHPELVERHVPDHAAEYRMN
nr:hypothetical protein [Nannocystis exedens]